MKRSDLKEKMKVTALAVIIKNDKGEHYQVQLTDKMIEVVKQELYDLFDGIVILCPNQIHGVEIVDLRTEK